MPGFTIHIAIAEASLIIRGGLAVALKRLPELNIQTIEITSKEGLLHYMEAHRPDILIINPDMKNSCIHGRAIWRFFLQAGCGFRHFFGQKNEGFTVRP